MDPERWKEVDRVLQAALERPAEERDVFLRQACGGDQALEGEVRALLAMQSEAGHFLDRPAMDLAAQGFTTREANSSAPDGPDGLIGRTVSHYRVLGTLGRGGMGVVYKAEDTRLRRLVALKVLPDALTGDAQRIARFEREARTLGSLN